MVDPCGLNQEASPPVESISSSFSSHISPSSSRGFIHQRSNHTPEWLVALSDLPDVRLPRAAAHFSSPDSLESSVPASYVPSMDQYKILAEDDTDMQELPDHYLRCLDAQVVADSFPSFPEDPTDYWQAL